MKFRFHKGYFALTISLFIIEVLIAAFVRDKFIRPYVGDFLVVILIYCFCKSLLNISSVKLAIGVLLFSYLVEISQYFELIKLLDLQRSTMAKIILGNSFAWMDMLVYTLGILLIIIIEKVMLRNGFAALSYAKN
ncbi:MAG: ribosomal maturation YjgA family protein [Bacteroidia bacterium]